MAYRIPKFKIINQVYQIEIDNKYLIFGEIIDNKLALQVMDINTGNLNKVSKVKIKVDRDDKPYVIYFTNKYYLKDFINRVMLPQFKNIGIFNLEDKYNQLIRRHE